MKKYNEGYTLPFVMAVLAVMCIVASSVLSVGLRNLQSQKNAINRMQDKYVAEGEIEKVIATLLDENSYKGTEKTSEEQVVVAQETQENPSTDTEGGDDLSGVAAPDEEMCKAIQKKINDLCGEYLVPTEENKWTANKVGDKDIFSYILNLKASKGSRSITCKVELSGTMKTVATSNGENEEKTTYEVTELSLIYKEYQIGGAA